MTHQKTPPQPDNFTLLTRTVSAKRINSYRQPSDTPIDTLGRYMWNVELCASLYAPLQNLEIAFRNHLHNAISKHEGTPDWFWESPCILTYREKNQFDNTIDSLRRIGGRIDADRVVAELTFGFWTSLLDRRYERILWPSLLKTTFPHIPRALRTRQDVSKRFNSIRKLRNRVFHHEPVWKRLDLKQDHDDIIDTIGWICPVLQRVTLCTDRFPTVHSKAYNQQICTQLQNVNLPEVL